MEEPRVYLKHRRNGRYFIRLHEEVSGRVWIDWTGDPRKATRFPSERRAEDMRQRLLMLGVKCWRVRLLPGVLERREWDERI